ncbi:MAG: secretion protein HlyD [Acidobacteriales bacterium]|nr:secretion protein HlyD [Terriglobales bacterium]
MTKKLKAFCVTSICALAVFGLLGGCSKAEKEVEPLVTVQIAKVETKALTETVTADAVLFPLQQAAITPKIAAPLSKIYVQRGDRVKEGQLLATLENADIAASVTENRGGFEQAQASFETSTKAGIPEELQKAELDRQQARENLDAQTKLAESRKSLFEQGALPRKDLDTAQVSYIQAKAQFEIADRHLASLNAVGQKASVQSANAQLAQARGKFEGAQAQLKYTEIRSPINGVVTDRPNFAGEMAPAGVALITVMDLSSIIGKAHISQAQAARLKIGDLAEIQVQGVDKPVPAKVSLISPALDLNSTTVEVWVRADNKGQRLRPGSAAKIEMQSQHEENALVIPQNSVLKDETGKTTVLVVDKETVHQREVRVGIQDSEAGLVQISSGLQAGEIVVTNQAYGLPDKTKVKIQEAESANAGKEKASEKKEEKD